MPTGCNEVISYKIDCPDCGKKNEHDVTHLLDGKAHSWGPWYCDECGGACKGEVTPTGDVTAMPARQSIQETLAVLKLDKMRLKDKDLYFLVKGMRFDKDGAVDPEWYNGARYWYEEHTCPTNFIRDTRVVVLGDDVDPHGLFSYLGAVEMNARWKMAVVKKEQDKSGLHHREHEYENALSNLSAADLAEVFVEVLGTGLLVAGEDSEKDKD